MNSVLQETTSQMLGTSAQHLGVCRQAGHQAIASSSCFLIPVSDYPEGKKSHFHVWCLMQERHRFTEWVLLDCHGLLPSKVLIPITFDGVASRNFCIVVIRDASRNCVACNWAREKGCTRKISGASGRTAVVTFAYPALHQSRPLFRF
jgi:hypothetical protein